MKYTYYIANFLIYQALTDNSQVDHRVSSGNHGVLIGEGITRHLRKLKFGRICWKCL